jgi:hypothetical protein
MASANAKHPRSAISRRIDGHMSSSGSSEAAAMAYSGVVTRGGSGPCPFPPPPSWLLACSVWGSCPPVGGSKAEIKAPSMRKFVAYFGCLLRGQEVQKSKKGAPTGPHPPREFVQRSGQTNPLWTKTAPGIAGLAAGSRARRPGERGGYAAH